MISGCHSYGHPSNLWEGFYQGRLIRLTEGDRRRAGEVRPGRRKEGSGNYSMDVRMVMGKNRSGTRKGWISFRERRSVLHSLKGGRKFLSSSTAEEEFGGNWYCQV